MKASFKKSVSALLAIVILVGSLSVVAFAADAKAVLEFRKTDDGYAEVISCDASAEGVISIPTNIKIGSKTYKVKYIGDRAFDGCFFITQVSIPEGVTAIGSNAFRDCFELRDVYIPESLVRCEFDAFTGCSNTTVHCFMANYQFVSLCGSYANIDIDIIDEPEHNEEEDSEQESDELVDLDELGFVGVFIKALENMIQQILDYFGVNDEGEFVFPDDLPFDLPFDIEDLPFEIE